MQKLNELTQLFPLSAIAVMSSLVMTSAHADVDTTFTLMGKITPPACTFTAPVAFNLGDIVASNSSSTTAIRDTTDGSIGKLDISCNAPRKFLLNMNASTPVSVMSTISQIGASQIGGAGDKSYMLLYANASTSQADYGAGLETAKGLSYSTAAGAVVTPTATGMRAIYSQYTTSATPYLAIVDSTAATTVASVKAASLDLLLTAYYIPSQVTSEANINDVHAITLTYL